MNTRALRFNTESESYQRIESQGISIRPVGRYQFAVSLTDSERTHMVRISVDEYHFHGGCTCDGWKFHQSACAHIWAVKRASANGLVQIHDGLEALDEPAECPNCGHIAPDDYYG